MKFLQSSCKIQILTKFLCLPREILENIAYIYHTYNFITGTITGHLSSSLFISAIIMSTEPSAEQAIKALQAQNAHFQELVMSLAQVQQDLKTLILKERKKKKKRTVLFNTRDRKSVV